MCIKSIALATSILTLSVCGGGGSSDTEPSQNPSLTPATVFTPTGSSSVAV